MSLRVRLTAGRDRLVILYYRMSKIEWWKRSVTNRRQQALSGRNRRGLRMRATHQGPNLVNSSTVLPSACCNLHTSPCHARYCTEMSSKNPLKPTLHLLRPSDRIPQAIPLQDPGLTC